LRHRRGLERRYRDCRRGLGSAGCRQCRRHRLGGQRGAGCRQGCRQGLSRRRGDGRPDRQWLKLIARQGQCRPSNVLRVENNRGPHDGGPDNLGDVLNTFRGGRQIYRRPRYPTRHPRRRGNHPARGR